MNQKNTVIFYVFLSIVISIFLFIMNFLQISSYPINFFRKIIISLIIIIICIIGFSVSIKPRWYKNIIKKKSNLEKVNNKKINREGHHPNCNQFQNHVLTIKNKIFCAGCTGLAIGASSSIIAVILYNLIEIKDNSIYGIIFIIGLIIIYFSFLESLFYNRKPLIHLLSNVLLIFGFLLIIISTLENSGDLVFGLISILFSFLFLETRIQIALLNHKNICLKCKNNCKMY